MLAVLLDPIGGWFEHYVDVPELPAWFKNIVDFLATMKSETAIALLVFALMALTFDAFVRRNIERTFEHTFKDLERHGKEVSDNIGTATSRKLVETYLGSAWQAASVIEAQNRTFLRPNLTLHLTITHKPRTEELRSDNILDIVVVSHWTVRNETNKSETYDVKVTDDQPRLLDFHVAFQPIQMSWKLSGDNSCEEHPQVLPPVVPSEDGWFRESKWPVQVPPRAEGTAIIEWRVSRHINDHYDIPLWYLTECVDVTVDYPPDLDVIVGTLGFTFHNDRFTRVVQSNESHYSSWCSRLPLLPGQGVTIKWCQLQATEGAPLQDTSAKLPETQAKKGGWDRV